MQTLVVRGEDTYPERLTFLSGNTDGRLVLPYTLDIDRSLMSGPSLVISYSRVRDRLIIPLANDSFDVKNATMPDGYTIEVVK